MLVHSRTLGTFDAGREPSQRLLILRHLQKGKKISPLSALRDYQCLRLAAVIHRLRREGHEINTEWREQGSTKYAVYRLQTANGEE